MSQAKAYSLMEAYYQVYIEDVNETLDEVTGGGYIPQSGTTYSSGYLSPSQQRRDKFKAIYGKDTGSMTIDQARNQAGIRSKYSSGSREMVPNRSGYGTARSRGGSESKLSMSPKQRAELAANRVERIGDTKRANTIRSTMTRPPISEELDTYDLVLDYLISEGIAETEDNAIQIMSSMSDEWIESILDEATKTVMSVTSPKGEQRRLNTTKASGPARTTIGPDRTIDSGERSEILRQIRRQRLGREGISFTPTAERNARKRGQEQVSANRQGTVNMRSDYIGYGLQRKYGISDKDFDPNKRTQGIPNKSVRLR